ncbi:MAG TPA: lipid A-modifier LpxR family protein, partial [Usitatibacter sp.]
ACAASTGAWSGEARWYTQIANDVVFGTDRWYTSGVRIARERDGVEWGLVQDIYTPDAKSWHPGKDDRAPTARLLASGAVHDRSPDAWQTIELALGVRGAAALGHQTTHAIHHFISAPHVDWTRQLGGRVDAQVAFTRSQPVGTDFVKVHYGATIGSQLTFAHAGLELRAGDTTLASSLLRFAPTPPFSTGSPHAWSAYFGASARAIGRNELISENYDPLGPDLKYRRSAVRFAAGVAWMPAWGALTLDVAQDAKEFDAQTAPQRFGSVAVHVAF